MEKTEASGWSQQAAAPTAEPVDQPLSNLVGKIPSTQDAEGRQPKRQREQGHLFVQLKIKVIGLQTSKGKVAAFRSS